MTEGLHHHLHLGDHFAAHAADRSPHRKRGRVEQAIHKAIFEHFAVRGATGVFAFHCPNGGARSPIEAAIFKSLGVTPGVPDIIAIRAGRVFALELKAPGKKPTPTQANTMEAMCRAGAIVAWAAGLDAALAQLEAWGLLRGTSQSARCGVQ